MPRLHLGVIDQPYSFEQQALGKNGKPIKRKKKVHLSVTTGQVAEWLENKYHPMEIYYEIHQQKIADDLAESMTGALESLMQGAPATVDPFGGATSKIEEGFKDFLSNKEMERLGYSGVPTRAALMGVNHRMARPYQKRAPRPSFVDTSTYQASAKSWVD